MAPIVEGDGEVAALPILLRRLNGWQRQPSDVQVLPPIRVRRDRFLNREDEFRRHLLLAAAKCGNSGWILVLLDADDDSPAELGRRILEKARAHVPHRRVSVVLAKRGYEAWFIAAADSLRGQRGFSFDAGEAVDAETPRNAKKMGGGTHGGRDLSRDDRPAGVSGAYGFAAGIPRQPVFP